MRADELAYMAALDLENQKLKSGIPGRGFGIERGANMGTRCCHENEKGCDGVEWPTQHGRLLSNALQTTLFERCVHEKKTVSNALIAVGVRHASAVRMPWGRSANR